MARLFAAHAALALGYVTEVEGLHDALRTRTNIGVAVGIVMNEYGLTQDAAFGLLVRSSSHASIKIRDIAQRMVDEANEKATR
jgi:AmiR/NasT family two-component response regulator